MLIAKAFLIKLLDYIKPQYGSATKVGNYYSTNDIFYFKHGGCVTVVIRGINLSALSARTTVANIPAGFRPMNQTYGMMNGFSNEYFIVNVDGTVQFNATSAKTVYGSATYAQGY